ncbi:MAG: diaminopimelate epimerase [Alphaproteobacteria bacterium]
MLPFKKMNGLGNEFAVIDARARPVHFSGEMARAIASRETGAGCDQVIVLERSSRAAAFMRILNADGSEVEACGNASRCIAAVLAAESGRSEVSIETGAELLTATVNADNTVTVDMGRPRFQWKEIPLAHAFDDTNAIDYTVDVEAAPPLGAPSVVNVGNPHCIFWVGDIDAYDWGAIGPRIEYDTLFPERVNASIAEVTSRASMRLVVWERGAGLTKACGTGACAAAVAAARKGLTGRKVAVELPGGSLTIEWQSSDDHILMTGPWELEYESTFAFDNIAVTA